MNHFRDIAYEQARNFRDKYQLGNYCATNLKHILHLLEKDERINIELIRTPFDNLDLAGFIGYKYDTFLIVTNTNQTLGYERFTIAHEIYHLIQNRKHIKDNLVMEEMTYRVDNKKDNLEFMADSFAAELLIPEKSIKENLYEVINNNLQDVDVDMVICLQQKYGVEYLAITRRLKEVGIISEKEEKELEKILDINGELQKLTKKLGHNNDINMPSKVSTISQRNLEVIKTNYEEGNTSYDDLIRIFGYLRSSPKKFGYEKETELTQGAKDFMKSLQ